MGPYAFAKLCEILRGTSHLQNTRNSSVEEQVAKFLYILAHNERIRTISFFFRCFSETISRHFHNMLRVVIYLEVNFFYNLMGQRFPHIYKIVIDFTYTLMQLYGNFF